MTHLYISRNIFYMDIAFFVCIYTPFPVALMYGGRSISRGQRLTVRQDDLLTVDIWR